MNTSGEGQMSAFIVRAHVAVIDVIILFHSLAIHCLRVSDKTVFALVVASNVSAEAADGAL
jgi:hypothetical protein